MRKKIEPTYTEPLNDSDVQLIRKAQLRALLYSFLMVTSAIILILLVYFRVYYFFKYRTVYALIVFLLGYFAVELKIAIDYTRALFHNEKNVFKGIVGGKVQSIGKRGVKNYYIHFGTLGIFTLRKIVSRKKRTRIYNETRKGKELTISFLNNNKYVLDVIVKDPSH